jgi:predicted nucleic acid-binding protein
VTDKIVDASAVVALLFREPRRESVVPRLRGASLHAPSLLEFEVANACVKKIRRTPGERQALLSAFSLLSELSISPETIDLAEAIALADRTKLSLYDASYLWLARALGVELVTLDDKLARADEAPARRAVAFDRDRVSRRGARHSAWERSLPRRRDAVFPSQRGPDTFSTKLAAEI